MGSASAGVGSALPDQDGFSGYVLTTDGVVPSWVAASTASLPAQGGQSGKYLTTNGTVASWAAVSALPDQTGNNGKVLGTNGTAASWVDPTALSLGNFGAAPAAKGADLTAGVLTMEPADRTNPGAVSTATQVFGGSKGFDVGAFVPATSDHATPVITLGNVTDTLFGLWMYPDTLPITTSNFRFGGGVDGSAYIRCVSTTAINFMVAAAVVATINATQLDLTGLGTGGAIKLKDAGGTTRTVTIDGAGAWVIT